MAKAPTDAAIREYISGYYEQSENIVSFQIKQIGFSPEGPQCREAAVVVTFDDYNSEGPTRYTEELIWTLWLEDGQVYGYY